MELWRELCGTQTKWRIIIMDFFAWESFCRGQSFHLSTVRVLSCLTEYITNSQLPIPTPSLLRRVRAVNRLEFLLRRLRIFVLGLSARL